MTATYENIATTTLSSASSTITLSSIPGTFTDLRLVMVGIPKTSIGSLIAQVRFNSDTGTNYSMTNLIGDGSSASSLRTTNSTRLQPEGFVTTGPMFFTMDVFSYAGSTNKTVLITNSTDRNGAGIVNRAAGLWRNTSAITTITLVGDGGYEYDTGTKVTLFGIKAE